MLTADGGHRRGGTAQEFKGKKGRFLTGPRKAPGSAGPTGNRSSGQGTSDGENDKDKTETWEHGEATGAGKAPVPNAGEDTDLWDHSSEAEVVTLPPPYPVLSWRDETPRDTTVTTSTAPGSQGQHPDLLRVTPLGLIPPHRPAAWPGPCPLTPHAAVKPVCLGGRSLVSGQTRWPLLSRGALGGLCWCVPSRGG